MDAITAAIKSKATSYREDATRFSDMVKSGTSPDEETWTQYAKVYRLVADELDNVVRQIQTAAEADTQKESSDILAVADTDYLDNL